MRFSLRAAWAALLLTATTLVIASSCVPEGDSKGSASGNTRATLLPEYVGSQPCAECHTEQFEAHRESYHAKTLAAMTDEGLGTLAPATGPIGKTPFSLTRVGTEYRWGLTDHPEDAMRLDLAFGSGKTGVTYVQVRDASTVEEARYTYFPHTGKWELTPGQESESAKSLSKPRANDAARQCVQCHAVTLEPNTLIPRKEFFGVGCESCHGPASAHVSAAKSGDFKTAAMTKLGASKAESINELCGKCHVSSRFVDPRSEDADATHRFTSYGLMKSPCYLKSNDTLSCVTCHNPHTNASTEEKTYVHACLSCHTPARDMHKTQAAHTDTTVCPVNPRDDCLTCHMPKRKAFKNSRIGTRLTDHYIRIWTDEERARLK